MGSFNLYPSLTWPGGETGRRTGLKIPGPQRVVRVRPPSWLIENTSKTIDRIEFAPIGRQFWKSSERRQNCSKYTQAGVSRV